MQTTKKLWLCFGLVISSLWLSAQTIRENEHGEKIIVATDGRWRYFTDPAGQWRDESTYPVFESIIEPLYNPVNLTEEDARRIANRKVQMAEKATLIAQERAEEARLQRIRIQEEYSKLINEGMSAEKARVYNLRLKAARQTEAQAQEDARLAGIELQRATELSKKGDLVNAVIRPSQNRAASTSLPPTEDLAVNFLSAFSSAATYFDLPVPPTTREKSCTYTYDGMDDRTGRWRRELEKRTLFTHTDDRLRMFMKDEEYMRCEGYLTAIDGGYRILTLEFTFAYPNAREAYGIIEKGSILTINLLNGDFINLQSGTLVQGSYDTVRDLLIYRVQYPIDHGQVSFLKNSEVESIRVFWSSGFEEYQVYELDFFIDQFACLDK